MKLYLASTSSYRASVLAKLHLPFTPLAPNIDETRQAGESAEELVSRLARQKAEAVRSQCEDGFIIGSDQVACLEDQILGKSGSIAKAQQQLAQFSGNKVRFLTGLCVTDAKTGEARCTVEPFDVQFRQLSAEQIARYVEIERPLDCAGSFKSEGLGIMLFSALSGRDPNALIGLPLIALHELFDDWGIDLFEHLPLPTQS